MSTVPRTAAEHYAESQRLLAVAEDAAIDPGIRDLAARMATAHAVLTLSPRRARPGEREARHTDNNNLPPSMRWGGDQERE